MTSHFLQALAFVCLFCLIFGHYISFFFNLILFFNFTILYWFCQISKWIRHRYTCVLHPAPPSLLPPHTIPLGHPSAPAPSILYHASNLDWQFVSRILYMFQCHSPKSSHICPLPPSPKDCSIHQCLFCCLVYRVIVIIFICYASVIPNSLHLPESAKAFYSFIALPLWCFSLPQIPFAFYLSGNLPFILLSKISFTVSLALRTSGQS